MHSKEDQLYLDNTPKKEREALVTFEAFARRNNIIKKYEYWYITRNEYQHIDRGDEQMILRCHKYNNKFIIKPEAFQELREIFHLYRDYNITIHAEGERSIRRPHFHIYN